MKASKIYHHALFLFLLCMFFAACDSDNVSAPSNGQGTLILRLTDSPFPIDLVAEANVTITKIDARNDSAVTGNPFIVLAEDTLSFNLLDLQNGVTATLVETDVPPGNYDLLRLFVSEANVVLKDSTAFDLKVPSGAQTGIKIFVQPAIQVIGDLSAELLLDFDVSKSFIVKGNPNTPAGILGFNFKPVIRAVNQSLAGTLAGSVSDANATILPEAMVWVEQDSIVSTVFTDDVGAYTIMGLPAGDYTVHATKSNHDTVSVSGISIVAGNAIQQDFVLTPIE